MNARNDLAFARRTLTLLDQAGVACWLFGGWAEELHGLRAPGPHKDIDLLYPARGFAEFDALSDRLGIEQIPGKRLAHKRALLVDGIMVELFLVQRDRRGLYTRFWDRARHDWPAGTLTAVAGLPAASRAALAGYRAAHQRLHAA